ncbi:MAG: type II secretion system secretin GspD [Gammaproteobacteria bacterium]|jgi:general secretion pathway protein D|nr:type II secretion system secretin GspD [Gammaproteobacteria bacterium]
MKIIKCTLLSLGLLFTSLQAYAEEVTLNFSDADLVAVINSVSQITGKNFIIDPRVKGKVTVVSSKPLNEAEVYNVFLSILQVHGFATVPTENAIKIIPDATAKQSSTPFTAASGNPEDQLITRVLTINHINAAQLVPILRPLVAQQGHLAAYPTTNVLIISDRASNILRIDRIIAQMDKEIDSDIEIIKLKHAFAAEVVRLLTGLNLTSPDQKAQAGGGIKINADERTNSVLLIGERTERLKYRAIIADLDSPVESSGNTHVIYLRYADAKNIATILSSVGQEAIKAEAKNVSAAGAGGGRSGETVNVQADEESNALVITAPASIFPSLRAVIQQLDIPRAQVHIEAIIAEVSLDTSNELGVQWLAVQDGKGAFSTRFPGETTIEDVAAGRIPDGLSLGLGNIQDSGLSFLTLIRALSGDGETNLLSTPSIVTLDNQEAEIIVGQNVPFVTGESTGSSSDTSNPFRTIERQDIGISLKVKPQINEGNAITLEIEQEVSAIAASSAGAVDIVTTKRSIRTTVQLEDEEMLVLGGLIDDAYIDNEQKVPFLGDIPGLGALFRSTKTSKVKRNLMVFIRATVIKDPDKARIMSMNKYNFMRDLQLESVGEEAVGPLLVPYE